jgi:enamine deaminase RidA (YjgF/YER057c/UK114 family)
MKHSNRRKFLAQTSAVAAAVALPSAAQAQAPARGTAAAPAKKVHWSGGKPPAKTPLFSGVVSYGNLVFLSGIGAHFEGDIKAHTKHVLDEMQKQLESVGSSMEKVLKVNVYLNDLKDYAGMN